MRHLCYILLISLGAVASGFLNDSPSLRAAEIKTSRLVVETRSGQHVFWVEVAKTPIERQRGLMFRRTLAPDRGMLFDYGRMREISMWMKNTYIPIPLDMVFIAQDGRVAHLVERTVPLSLAPIPSQGPVRAVPELGAGSVERLGVRPGDRVIHAVFGNVE